MYRTEPSPPDRSAAAGATYPTLVELDDAACVVVLGDRHGDEVARPADARTAGGVNRCADQPDGRDVDEERFVDFRLVVLVTVGEWVGGWVGGREGETIDLYYMDCYLHARQR